MSSLSFSAVLLAAGQSSRMGRDKALLPVDPGEGPPYRGTVVGGGPVPPRAAGDDRATERTDHPGSALPLWRRQWAVLTRTGVAKIQLSVRPEQNWVPAGIPVVHDAQVDAGPLAGLAAAMAAMTSTHLLVLAVDLPHMEGAWFSGLMKLCSPGVGAVGRHEGYFEPLAAIYPRELLVAAEATLAGGDRSLQRFIVGAGDAMRHHEITSAEAPWFANWNEPVN